MDKLKLKVDKDELIIEEGEDSFLGKLIEGARGRIKIRTPFGEREIRKVKDKGGKVFEKDIGKPKREKASK